MADAWEPPTLAMVFHWIPRVDLEGNEVSSSYNIHSYSYREGLLQIANLHLLWLFLVFLMMLIYLLYRWFVQRPRDIVRVTCPRKNLRQTLLLICVVLLLFCFFLEFIVQSIYVTNLVMDSMGGEEDLPDIERDVEPHVTAFFNKPSSMLYHIRYWSNYNFRATNPPPIVEWTNDNFHSNLYSSNDDESEVNRVADETNLRQLVELYDGYVKRSIAELNIAMKNKSLTNFNEDHSNNDDPKKILEEEISRYDRLRFFLIIWTVLLVLLLLAVCMLRNDKFFWVPVYFALWMTCVAAAGLTVTCVALGDACQNPEKNMLIEKPDRSAMENNCKRWTSQVYVTLIDLARQYIDSMIKSLYGLRSSVFEYCDIEECKKPEYGLHNAAYYFGVYTRRQIYEDFRQLDDKLTDFVLKCSRVLRNSHYDTRATVKSLCDDDRLMLPIVLQLISNLVIAGILIAVMFIYISSRQCILPVQDQLRDKRICISKRCVPMDICMQNRPLLMASFSGETPDVIVTRARRSRVSSPDKDVYAPYKEHIYPQRHYTPRCLTLDKVRDDPGSQVVRRRVKPTHDDTKRSDRVGTPRKTYRQTSQNTCIPNKQCLYPQTYPPTRLARLSGSMELQQNKLQVKESKPSLKWKQNSNPESLKERQYEQERSGSDSDYSQRSEGNLCLDMRDRTLRSVFLSPANVDPCSTQSPLRLKSPRTNTSSRTDSVQNSTASIRVQNIREFKEHAHIPCDRAVDKQRNNGRASSATLFERPQPHECLQSYPHNILPSFSRSTNSCRPDDDKETNRNRAPQAISNPNLKDVVLNTATAGWQSRPNIQLHFTPPLNSRQRNNENLPDSIKKEFLPKELSIERNSSTTISPIDTLGVSPPGSKSPPSKYHELTLNTEVLDVPSCSCDLFIDPTPPINAAVRRKKGRSGGDPASFNSLPIRVNVSECPLLEQITDESLPAPDCSGARNSPRDRNSKNEDTAEQKERLPQHTANEKISGSIEDHIVSSPYKRSRTSERYQHQKPCVQKPLSLSNSMSCTRKTTSSRDNQSPRTLDETMFTSDDHVDVATPKTPTSLTSQLTARQTQKIFKTKRLKTVYLKIDRPSNILSPNVEEV